MNVAGAFMFLFHHSNFKVSTVKPILCGNKLIRREERQKYSKFNSLPNNKNWDLASLKAMSDEKLKDSVNIILSVIWLKTLKKKDI